MNKKNAALLTAVLGGALLLSIPVITAAANDGRAKCYECHDEIKAMKESSKHASLSCSTCHDKVDAHINDPEANKPVTIIDQALCGKCHKNQYDSFFKMNYESAARKEKGVPTGRSPMQDKLLEPYGFTIEHNEPRGHAFMVVDQFIVDRFQGGRYQYKEGWMGYDKPGKTWDVLKDQGDKFKAPETAMAGNPTCIQCKTSDHVLKWKFMGEKDSKAKWDRTSNVNDVAKDTNNPVGCIHCHDPHGTQPRIIRDALIQAIGKDSGGNIFSKGGKTDLDVKDFRGFRKIGVMSKTDSRMMCAQCHVEYACGTGGQWSNGAKVGYDDQRTNHMPLKNAKDLLAHYKKLDFYDFKHAVTGARLIKMQHPEAETFAGSVHDKAGIQCHQCHMPKLKGENGKEFSNHGVIRPKNHIKEACLGCHPEYTVEQKLYQIETIQNYTKSKMRKAEYWIGQLIDNYAFAKRAGVPEETLAKAREKHEEAHALWEFWTAENSDGFHNPDLARDTLTGSIKAAKDGVALLKEAMVPKKP